MWSHSEVTHIELVDSFTSSADSKLYKITMFVAGWAWRTCSSRSCGGSCRPTSVVAMTSPFQTGQQNYWDANGSSGLCYWMGLESIFAPEDRRVLVADMRSAGLPDFGINIKPLAQVNALLLDNVFIPGIRFFGG